MLITTHKFTLLATLLLLTFGHSAAAEKPKKVEEVKAKKSEAKKAEAPKEVAKKAEEESDKQPKVDFSSGDVWNVDIFDRPDHKVLVIQDRKFTKAGKFELGGNAGFMVSSPFYNSYIYGGQLAYHFTEYLALEGFGNQSKNSLSADGKQVNNFLKAGDFEAVKEYHEPKWLAGAMVIWSPIYGKFAFFRSSIIHFDIYGGLGASKFKTDTNAPASIGGEDQTHTALTTSLGMRVFLNSRFNLRFDVKNLVYRADFATVPDPAGDIAISSKTLTRSSFQYAIGLSVLLGSGKVSNQNAD